VSRRLTLVVLNLCLMVFVSVPARNALGQQPSDKPAPPPVDEWMDDFSGSELNPAKWERFSIEGGNGGTLKLEQGELRLRSVSGSRAGVLNKQAFKGDHFLVEATIAKAGSALPEAGQNQAPGNAIVTVLFDNSGRNRVEWLLTSEGLLEAWAMTDGRGERLDGRNLATKAQNPTLAIVRRGDEFLFMLNGQEGLRKNLKGMPRSFHVMLYGFGSSENNWDSVRVVTVKQSK
jgi:hypothetical protein